MLVWPASPGGQRRWGVTIQSVTHLFQHTHSPPELHVRPAAPGPGKLSLTPSLTADQPFRGRGP